jgi:uridine phosphorylase
VTAGATPSVPAGFFVDGEPHVSPSHAVEHLCRQRGVTRDVFGVRPVMVATFGAPLTAYLAERWKATPAAAMLHDHPAYIVDDAVGLITLPIGAPAAVSMQEELIVCGMRTMVVPAAAGSIDERAPIGTTLVPSSAIREEGTSHHYAPHDVLAEPSPRVVESLLAVCAQRGVEPLRGGHWTTDAVYREHASKVAAMRDAGALTVDMELSALFIVAAHRGTECAAILVVSDELYGDSWDIGFGADTFTRAIVRAGNIAVAAAQRLA